MASRFIIYGLVDPRDGQLRYVGKSCVGLKRVRQHGQPSHLARSKGHKGNWIRNLRAGGYDYQTVVIQEFSESDLLSHAEVFWIAYFRQMGCRLTNLTDGGEGAVGRRFSEASLAKMSAAHKGKMLGNRLRVGKMLSDEHRAAISAALIGNTHTLGRPHTKMARLHMSAARKGKRHSEETKAKIGVARLGVKHTPEARAKMSAARRGGALLKRKEQNETVR